FVFIFESENKDLIRNELSAYLFPAVLKSSEIAQEYRLRLEKSLESRFKQVKFGSLFPFQYLLVSIFSIIILLLPQFQNFVKDTHQWIAFYSFLYPSSSHLKFELVDFKKAYLKNQSLDLKIAIDGVPLFPVQIKVSDEKGIVLEDLVASEFIQLAKDQFHLKIDLKGFSKKVYLQCFSGSDQSKMYLLNMVDFPRVTKSEYRLDYPAYLQKKSKTLAYLPKKILFGSDFVEKLFFNKKMEKVKTSNTAGKLLKKSDVYHLQFHMDKNLEYQIDFQDSDGFSSKSRKRMIAIKKDELPSIKVLKPISPKKIPAGILDRLPIKLKINDDFLVEKVQIEITSRQRFEMTYMSSQELIDIPIESSSHLLIETSLELSSLYLQEGDKVKFIIKAWDQLKSRGPDYSITGILYVPYMFEEAQESEENAQEVMEDLQKIAQEQKIQEAALKKLSEKKDSYQAVSAVDQKKLKDLLKKQKKLQQKANEIDKKISETLENDREKNLLDEESLRKLEQIKDIYQDLMSQMDRNMMQMNQSMKDLSQKKMNSMMKKFDSKKYS
ncbi:hypothetical protein MJH12_15045, partial [bacterium]|nr:hypothetical protein [bacterium]